MLAVALRRCLALPSHCAVATRRFIVAPLRNRDGKQCSVGMVRVAIAPRDVHASRLPPAALAPHPKSLWRRCLWLSLHPLSGASRAGTRSGLRHPYGAKASGSCLRARVELAAKGWLPTMPSRSAASALDPYAAGAHDESARRSDRGHAASDAPSGPARPPHAGFKRPSPQGWRSCPTMENTLVSSHMNLIRKLTPPPTDK